LAPAKTNKKQPQQATSNVFAMFDQSQIQEIEEEDLDDMLASMGKSSTDEYLEGMMSEVLRPIHLTVFLTMFGTDPKEVIHNAFACYLKKASGFIHEDHLQEMLTTIGDSFTDNEVHEMHCEAPIDKKGNFNYVEFTHILKHAVKEKDN
uniref:EF-hand domain-containing protein n=1 Tax=Equus asinus asinus TaxID=83772 RepID=A0A8C4KXR2_EQUAS